MSSIKKNFVYSSILTVSNYIFPLLTYPYISRVLGVSNIGVCNFIDSIINYFILFSMLGMSVVGIREIASTKENHNKLNKTFSELFVFSGITTIFATILLILAMFIIPSLQQYKLLLSISIIKLIGNFFLIEWFYKGIEDFKYITNRTIIVKIVYVLSVFCFVRKSEDVDIYILLTSMMVGVNAIFNCIYARKKVRLVFNNLDLKHIIKPNFVLGFQFFLTSMYTSVNVIFLGFVANTTEVGYYATATKLYSVVIALYQAYTGVLLPRMSALHSNNETTEFKSLISKSISILLIFLIPIVIYSMVYCPQIIELISGRGYEGAIIPSIIIFPLLFVIGYDQIMMIQVLMPYRLDKALLICSIVGAVVGIICNLIFVPSLYSIGSAITWLCSELAVVISAQYYVYKNVGISFPFRNVLKHILIYLPMLLPMYGIRELVDNYILILLLGFIIMILYVTSVQKYILKDPLVVNLLNKIKNKYGYSSN